MEIVHRYYVNVLKVYRTAFLQVQNEDDHNYHYYYEDDDVVNDYDTEATSWTFNGNDIYISV